MQQERWREPKYFADTAIFRTATTNELQLMNLSNNMAEFTQISW